MKVALVAPIEETIPPTKYGGVEWIVYYLAKELSERGHLVDLYTARNSPSLGKYHVEPIIGHNIRQNEELYKNTKLKESTKLLAMAKAVERINSKDYDVVHNHAGWRFILYSRFLKKKPLTTLHFILSQDFESMVYREHQNLPYISISNNQRQDLPSLNFVKTVYNGSDTQAFSFSPTNDQEDEYMLFLARLQDTKGTFEAVKTAHKLKRKLILAVKLDAAYNDYYEKIKPYIDGKIIQLVGETDLEQKIKLLRGAKCLLVPIKWEEPFGLMFTESMACGTPVITFARGSAPEIIKDGKTGFLVNQSQDLIRGNWITKETGVNGLCNAVNRLFSLSQSDYHLLRAGSRQHIEANFSVTKMVDEYESVYFAL